MSHLTESSVESECASVCFLLHILSLKCFKYAVFLDKVAIRLQVGCDGDISEKK